MKYSSPIISHGSGSMGGSTYSHNRYGQYMRNRVVPVNPNSSRQAAVRSVFADLTQHWLNTLSTAQREAWDNYAANVAVQDKLGDSIYLTGFNHYLRSNTALLQAGLTRVDDGPVILTLPETDTGFAVAASEATQLISVTFTDTLDLYDEDGAALLVSAGRGVNPTINFYNAPFRFADSIDGNSGSPPTSPLTMTAPFSLAEDQRFFAKGRIVRADGRLSSPFWANATCAS
jgi:hypothetical protein